MELPRDLDKVTEENKSPSKYEHCLGKTTLVEVSELVPCPRVRLSSTRVGRYRRG